MIFPLTVMRTQFGLSLFCGRTSTTTLAYVSVCPAGISDFLMKKIVLIKSTRPLMPCASQPNSFAHYFVHISFIFGCFKRSLYSSWAPVSGSVTALAIDISITAGAGCRRYDPSFSVSNTAHAKPRLRNGYLSASAYTLGRCASLLHC